MIEAHNSADAENPRVTGSDAILKWSEEEEPDPEVVREAVKKKLDEVYAKLEVVPSILKPLLSKLG